MIEPGYLARFRPAAPASPPERGSGGASGRRTYRLVIPDEARAHGVGKVNALIAQLFAVAPEGVFWRSEDQMALIVQVGTDRPDDTGRAVAALVVEVDRVAPRWRAG